MGLTNAGTTFLDDEVDCGCPGAEEIWLLPSAVAGCSETSLHNTPTLQIPPVGECPASRHHPPSQKDWLCAPIATDAMPSARTA